MVKNWEVTGSSPRDSSHFPLSQKWPQGESPIEHCDILVNMWLYMQHLHMFFQQPINVSQMCSEPESALEVVLRKERCIDLECTPAALAAVHCSCCSFDVCCGRGTLGQQDHLITSLQSTEHWGMASSYKRTLNPTWCLTCSACFKVSLKQSLLVICENKDSENVRTGREYLKGCELKWNLSLCSQ